MILPGRGSREIGRISFSDFGFEILGNGTIVSLFQHVGNIQHVSDPLYNFTSLGSWDLKASIITMDLILSSDEDLFTSILLIILEI